MDAQLLAQRNTLMPALGNPGRTVPPEADAPTRAAAEAVLRRDNLLSLMKQTDLLNRWDGAGPWLLRFKDRVMDPGAPPSEEERINAMIGFLEERLTVKTARVHGDHRHRLAGRAAGLPAGGHRPAELPRPAPRGRGVHHRRDHLHPRGPRHDLREAIDDAMEDIKRRHGRSATRHQPRRSPAAPARPCRRRRSGPRPPR